MPGACCRPSDRERFVDLVKWRKNRAVGTHILLKKMTSSWIHHTVNTEMYTHTPLQTSIRVAKIPFCGRGSGRQRRKTMQQKSLVYLIEGFFLLGQERPCGVTYLTNFTGAQYFCSYCYRNGIDRYLTLCIPMSYTWFELSCSLLVELTLTRNHWYFGVLHDNLFSPFHSSDPMRITKKFAGASCIGKQVFQPCDGMSTDHSELEIEELHVLEVSYYRRVGDRSSAGKQQHFLFFFLVVRPANND